MPEIVICYNCKGEGYITNFVRVSLDESEYQTSVCRTCNGSGRLIKTVSYEPYKIKNIKGR